jgi:hypothetical protein
MARREGSMCQVTIQRARGARSPRALVVGAALSRRALGAVRVSAQRAQDGAVSAAKGC